MMIEAVRKDLVKPPNILKKLKKFPERIKQLNEYFINTLKIPEMNIVVKPVSLGTILTSQAVRSGRIGVRVRLLTTWHTLKDISKKLSIAALS